MRMWRNLAVNFAIMSIKLAKIGIALLAVRILPKVLRLSVNLQLANFSGNSFSDAIGVMGHLCIIIAGAVGTFYTFM